MEHDAEALIDYCLTTTEFAKPHKVKPESVLARYNRTGSYFGSVPKKAPNGRLFWPAHATATQGEGNV